MSLKICVLGSGSKGNCACVWSAETSLLIDMGLPAVRVEKCLKLFSLDPAKVTVLVTHAHVDHVGGLCKFVKKYNNIVYADPAVCDELVYKYGIDRSNLRSFSGGDFFVGALSVTPFKVSHDVPCVGYVVASEGKKIAFATDVGRLSDSNIKKLSVADLVVLEANHDEDMLKDNDKYPFYLKNRILSDKGHLSNEAAAEASLKLAQSGVKQIILAHLSQENNLPELAFATVRDKLASYGFLGEREVKIEVALQDRMTGLYEIV